MRIGLLVEGGIDEEILPPLVNQLVAKTAAHKGRGFDYYPVPFPPNGYGEIPKNLRMLVRLYEEGGSEWRRIGCDLFLVVLDSRKTDGVQKEIAEILRDAPGFPAVYGLAVQETEAWVLGDIDHLNRYVFKVLPEPQLPISPERDPDPKKTLTDLYVRPSTAVEYDVWNTECAQTVAGYLREETVASRCPRGFGKLAQKFKTTVRRIK